jgi:hypothetical protein
MLELDSSLSFLGGSNKVRKGKWTAGEEEYANKIIECFNLGILSTKPGVTLRNYLSARLQCDPMRITKKYTGPSCIGKQIFQPRHESSSELDQEYIGKRLGELEECERRFHAQLENKYNFGSSYPHSSVHKSRSMNFVQDWSISDRAPSPRFGVGKVLKRSQSNIEVREVHDLEFCARDASAAGDLLLQFSRVLFEKADLGNEKAGEAAIRMNSTDNQNSVDRERENSSGSWGNGYFLGDTSIGGLQRINEAPRSHEAPAVLPSTVFAAKSEQESHATNQRLGFRMSSQGVETSAETESPPGAGSQPEVFQQHSPMKVAPERAIISPERKLGGQGANDGSTNSLSDMTDTENFTTTIVEEA